MEPDSEPRKLTIVTVVFNAADLLEATIRSVRKAEFPQIEYIVIDGGSQDGTLDIIHDNSDSIDIWISDRDKGLYDAMNKGLMKATGEYVLFLNSGDLLFDSTVLEKVFSDNSNADVYYGNTKRMERKRWGVNFCSKMQGFYSCTRIIKLSW
jgi:glycosyltransferase involved in cell wall biosynthesis